MAMITLDDGRCTRCGLCVAVCPNGALQQAQAGEQPEIVRPQSCIRCGHCVAVCPHDALTHADLDAGDFPPVPETGIGADAMEGFLSSKRSVRAYRDRPVDRDAVERLLGVARMAPSAHNAQERGFVAVTDPAVIDSLEAAVARFYERLLFWVNPVVRALLKPLAGRAVRDLEAAAPELARLVRESKAGRRPVFRGAPCVVLIHGRSDNVLCRDDCLAAQHYLMMQAHAMGLGTCIIGYASVAHRTVERLAHVPKGHRVFAVAIVGHPAVEYRRLVSRRPAAVSWL